MTVTAVDLFSGCGGLSYGDRLAGAELGLETRALTAVDLWPAACATYAYNLGVAPRIEAVSNVLLAAVHSAVSTNQSYTLLVRILHIGRVALVCLR